MADEEFSTDEDENVDDIVTSTNMPVHEQYTYLVFQSVLKELFKYCGRCGATLDQTC